MTAPPSVSVGAGSIPPITEAEFALLRDLIHRHSGIHLSDGKAPLLVGRLTRRLRALELPSFGDYYRHLMEGRDPDEIVTMLDCITTNETRFFREARQFDFLEDVVLPEWRRAGARNRRARRVRAWSAACSTGEEAYSLAMCLLSHLPASEDWSVDVLGTDLSTRALTVARAGVWRVDGATSIPEAYLGRFMRRGTRSQEGQMKAVDALKAVVRFERLNLHAGPYDVGGPFDIVFCRNVLIYFAEPARSETLQWVASQVRPGGYLFLGHAETPGRRLDGMEPVRTMIFRAPPRDGGSTS